MRLRTAAIAASLCLGWTGLAALTIAPCVGLASVTTTTRSVDYVGNGVTTVYALPFRFLANADILVQVATVTKTLGVDYTLKGAGLASLGSVTFTTAPANGAAIHIERRTPAKQPTSFSTQGTFLPQVHEASFDRAAMALQDAAAPNTTVDANSLAVTASGSTSARVLSVRTAEAKNVRDFGAVGDGATNDATAINATITAAIAAKSNVYVPAGTYLIGSPIAINSAAGLSVYGDGLGSVISATFTGAAISVGASSSRVIIEKLKIVGAMSQGVLVAGTFVTVRDSYVSGATVTNSPGCGGIVISSTTDVWVEDNYLTGNGLGLGSAGSSGDIITAPGGTGHKRLHITGNHAVSSVANVNIGLWNAEYSDISGNYCANAVTQGDASSGGYGIMVYLAGGAAGKNNVRGNVVYNVNGSGIYIQGAANTAVANNTIENCALTQTDAALPVGGIAWNAADYGTILGNSIKASTKAGISLTNSSIAVADNVIQNTLKPAVFLVGSSQKNLSITGNTIYDAQTGIATIDYYAGTTGNTVTDSVISGNTVRASKTGQPAIGLKSLSYCTIQGNIVYSNPVNGIALQASDHLLVAGNVVRDNGTAAANVSSGLKLADTTDSVVSGNYSANSGATGQKYGIEESGTSDRNIYRGNYFATNQTGALSIAGASSVKIDNQISVGLASGVATLVTGTKTVSTAEVKSGDVVELTRQAAGGTLGILSLGTITDATSFVINSSNAADTSVVAWKIRH